VTSRLGREYRKAFFTVYLKLRKFKGALVSKNSAIV
jgi:hypothetical protein